MALGAVGITVTVTRPVLDALGKIAESFLRHGEAALNAAERQQIIVHVDAQVLSEGGPGRCELEDGPSLAAETARLGGEAPTFDWQHLPGVHAQQGLHIDADTAATGWRGERMDYDLAAEVLFQQARRGGGRNFQAMP